MPYFKTIHPPQQILLNEHGKMNSIYHFSSICFKVMAKLYWRHRPNSKVITHDTPHSLPDCLICAILRCHIFLYKKQLHHFILLYSWIVVMFDRSRNQSSTDWTTLQTSSITCQGGLVMTKIYDVMGNATHYGMVMPHVDIDLDQRWLR